jgi:hypothetical protein
LLEDILRAKTLVPLPKQLEIRLYDYEIGIFSMPISVRHPDKYHSNYQLFLETLRDIGVEFAALQIQALYQNYIARFLDSLAAKAETYFDSDQVITHETVSRQDQQVLWVTRSMIFESQDVESTPQTGDRSPNWVQDFISYWLKDTGVPEQMKDADDNQKRHLQPGGNSRSPRYFLDGLAQLFVS